MYKGRETDLVSRGEEAAEVKDRDAAPSKLKKEIGGQLTQIGTYKSRATVKKTAKNI